MTESFLVALLAFVFFVLLPIAVHAFLSWKRSRNAEYRRVLMRSVPPHRPLSPWQAKARKKRKNKNK